MHRAQAGPQEFGFSKLGFTRAWTQRGREPAIERMTPLVPGDQPKSKAHLLPNGLLAPVTRRAEMEGRGCGCFDVSNPTMIRSAIY